MSARCRMALCKQEPEFVYRPPHLLLMGLCWPLHGLTPTLTMRGPFTESEDPTITAGLFNTKPRLTSWPHLAPAFCGLRRIGADVSWSYFSKLMKWNNIAITSRVKYQQIHFCTAVLIVTYKQRNYSCPNSPSYTLRCCALYSTVFGCMNMMVQQ